VSFKVAVIVSGETKPSYNGLRFATREEAEKNGRDLANRWILVNSFTVEESSAPVNYQWTDEGLKAVEPTAAADSAA
jgi:hypothetical protein